MSHTYTVTLEEQALAAMCSRRSVRLVDSGAVGVITEIYVSCVGADQRRIAVREADGRVEHADLTYGAVEYL